MKEICNCGKEHVFTSLVLSGEGVINALPRELEKRNLKKAFLLADKNTYKAAGEKVSALLKENGISVCEYIFQSEKLEPNEENVGLAVMNYNTGSDVLVAVGSGVINDIGKIVANIANKPYVIVATAPSMDGYASASSSMTREGLKISLSSKCADIIVGDAHILASAPTKMMASGLGDMIAKYISICEWRISNLINGEYYCEKVAELVRSSLKNCIDNIDGLMKKEKGAVLAVFDGLITCGAAMKFAGVSRPASGIEHYISHIWDMRGVEFNTPVELHGIQCAIGTLISAKLYEKLKTVKPDEKKALEYVNGFNFTEWSEVLRNFLGKGATSMVALEEKEQKYNPETHKERLKKIIENWDNILKIVDEEIPSVEEIERILDKVSIPKLPEEIGIDKSILPLTIKSAKDIRDKYVLPRLLWDLGIIEEMI
jgi:glycerol-1-phosphate dehydrogenase [NAD(P)+]